LKASTSSYKSFLPQSLLKQSTIRRHDILEKEQLKQTLERVQSQTKVKVNEIVRDAYKKSKKGKGGTRITNYLHQHSKMSGIGSQAKLVPPKYFVSPASKQSISSLSRVKSQQQMVRSNNTLS